METKSFPHTEAERALPEPYFNSGRRVFSLWAAIIFFGFIATHFYPMPVANYYWVALSLLGLGYMKKQISFEFKDLRNIFMVWLTVVVVGMVISFMSTGPILFYLPIVELSGYLGVFWMVMMAIGHAITGLIDKKQLYIGTTALQLVAAVATFYFLPLLAIQYIVAGVAGGVAMLMLVIYA